MSVLLNKKRAIFWGEFIEVTSSMDRLGVTNPQQPSNFPKNWKLIKNISMNVNVGFVTQKEFIGIVAQSVINPERHAVILHGNVGTLDFLQELNVSKTDFPFIPNGGKTEVGFTRLYESFSFIDPATGKSENLRDYLRGLDPALFFTVAGYSVGGALGMMHALVLAYQGNPVEAYIIGSPMAGDADFVRTYNSHIQNSYVIINKPDLVPHLPGSLFGYRHVKTIFEINSDDFPEINRNIYCYHSLEVYLYVLGAKDIDLGLCRAAN